MKDVGPYFTVRDTNMDTDTGYTYEGIHDNMSIYKKIGYGYIVETPNVYYFIIYINLTDTSTKYKINTETHYPTSTSMKEERSRRLVGTDVKLRGRGRKTERLREEDKTYREERQTGKGVDVREK